MRRTPGSAVLFIVVLAGVAVPTAAQSSRPPAAADYGQWETLAPQPRGGLSPDGQWLVYGINRSNRNNELRVAKITDGATKTVPFGSQAAFSADSRWLAYAIGYSEAQEEKARQQKKPLQRKAGLLNLATGETTVVDAVESFAFDAAGTHIALRRFPPERKEPAPAPSVEDATVPAGATLIVRDLATGRDTTFGNVSEFAWQDKGALIAFTISADGQTGNGVQLYEPASAVLRVLDSAPAVYAGLTWRDDSDDLAVLRGRTDERRDGATEVLLAWTGAAGAAPVKHAFDPTEKADFPAGMRTVAFRRPSWSDTGDVVFVGVAKWEDKPDAKPDSKSDAADNEPASVDIWHARDIEVIPRQKLSIRIDRQRNLLAAWHLESGALVQLAHDGTEQVTPLKHQALAYAASWAPYAMERTIGRPSADIALVDTATGARTRIVDRIDDRYLQASPGGRYLLYFNADHYWTVDTHTHAIVNITKTVPASFVNRESDATVRQKPPFGVAGWTPGDGAVLLYDKFDIWQVAADGTKAVRLTDGAGAQVRHRYARVDPDAEWIDTGRPIVASLFGIWSKKSGYARIAPGTATVTPLVWDDLAISGLGKAKDAEVYPTSRSPSRTRRMCSSAGRISRAPGRSRPPIPSSPPSPGAAARSSSSNPNAANGCRARCSIPPATSPGRSTRWSSTSTSASRTACIATARRRNATTTTPRCSRATATSSSSPTSSSAPGSRASRWSSASGRA